MARMKLSLETLKDFDSGKAHVAWLLELKRVVLDILDRPGDKHARTVALKTTIKPVMEQDGDVVDAEVDFQITTKLPPRQTAVRQLAVTRDGQLVFSEFAPDNPHQMSLETEEE